MNKLIVGIPTSIILMLSSCTATLEEFQTRNGEDTEEVAEQDEPVVQDSVDEDDTRVEDPPTEEEGDVAVEEDEETIDDDMEDTADDESSDVETDEDIDEEAQDSLTNMDIPEEVIQEFVRLGERVDTMESRLSTMERHLNEAEDEIARLYDALGNRASERMNENVDDNAERTDIEVLTTEDGQGTRSTPFNVGDTVAIEIFDYANGFNRLYGTAEITITDVVIGDEAHEKLLEESRFNTEAPDGFEWAIITVSFYLADFADDDVSVAVSDSVSIVTETGSKPPNTYALPPNPLTYTEIFSGGEVRGNVAKLVPEDESFLIFFDSFKAEDLFFLYEVDDDED